MLKLKGMPPRCLGSSKRRLYGRIELMPGLIQLALLIIAILFVGLVLHCIRKGVLRERYALLWLGVSGGMLGMFALPLLV